MVCGYSVLLPLPDPSRAIMPAPPRFYTNPSSIGCWIPRQPRPVAWAFMRKTSALLWLLLLGTSLSPTWGQVKIPLETVKLWADTFGGDLYNTVTKYSGSLLLQKKYKDVEPSLKIEEVDGLELVRKFSEDMETMLRRKVEAVQNLVEAAEEADLNHEFNESLVFDYYNSVLINERDENGNFVELGAEFLLESNAHFSNLPVNTSISSVQLPTNVYNKDPEILNGVYMSEALNAVFVENFQRDPTLTWQYFGSATGFFRIYPGILVQADRDNREHFKLLVEELMVKGVGIVDQALREAFEILKQFQEAKQGSLCNQAIMLISDGAVEDYQPVFEKYNWPDCKISTLADTQENVMEYLHVLSRPMVINHDHDIIWTEAYMDSKLLSSQTRSLTLLTTVAMPVFSKKNETRSHGILLGVVGSDVALRELMKLAPRYRLGVHGYAFLNTNNGYILSHPDLRPLYREGKKLKPKPNYNSVDLSEVEWEDQAESKRVLFLTNDYFFTDISDTPFSLGVVLSRGHGEYILLGNTSVEEGLHDLLHPDLALASDWIYCITDIDPEHRKLSQLEAMVRFLTREDPDLECDEELVREVLFDAVVTAPMEAYWTALALNISEESEQVADMAFLGTRAGLLRSSLFVGSEKISDRKFLTPEDEASVFTLDRFPLWYRQASEHPAGSFVFNLRWAEGPESAGEPMVVTASTAVAVTVDKKTAIAAAVGVQMKLEFLQRKFWAATQQCNTGDMPCTQSCEDSDLDCFVVDNNGFILISERSQEPGIKLRKKPIQTL
uniref:Calcium voltage-gated channel auxiliary subunit alpha2delta 4 n=1 Tax=Saimiri boliviensis boliviensis TaxID=39432 RepID=A0A2K6SER8_SAIBB